MKKYLVIFTITVVALVNSKSAYSQSEDDGCPQRELVKRYLEIQDSVARFLNHVKKTTDSVDYSNFTTAILTDSIDAFNVFGITRKENLKDSMNALMDSLKVYTGLIRMEIDPNLTLTDSQFATALNSKIACVNADPAINTISYLLENTFGTGASILRLYNDDGCADNLRAALTAARASYNYAMVGCAAGAGCPGWWKVACVAACYVYNATVYNENKIDAFCDYRACMNLSCPFN